MTLYARISLLLLGFVTASTLALAWLSDRARMEDFLTHRDESATTLTAAIAKSVFNDTLEGQSAKVRDTLRAIVREDTEIVYIVLIGFDGEVFASTYHDQVPHELGAILKLDDTATPHRQLSVGGREISDFSHPLISNLEAHIHVGYDATRFNEKLRKGRSTMLGLMLTVAVLALLIANFAARFITHPLQQLTTAVRDYAMKSTFDPTAIDVRGPEVGLLVSSFAAMVEEHRQTEQDLRIAAAAFESREPIIITDANLHILRVNHAFLHLTGYPACELIGQTPALLHSGRHDALFYERMWKSLQLNGTWNGEVWDRRHDGAIFPAWLTITAVKDTAGRTTHYIGNFLDISEQKHAEARIQRLAYHDSLTGLPNRFSLQERMEQVIALARRDQQRFALMLIDLDRFKQINDTLGHHIGDQLLIQVSQRLLESVRDSDIVARLGGDEFIVVLNALESPDIATHLADKIVGTLSEPFHIAGNTLGSSPSIGICLFPDDAETLDELIQHADVAMYEAKAQGRGRHVNFTPQMKVAVTRRMVIEQELHSALMEQQFVLHYQPQLDLRTQRICGVEALIRWQHPQRGLVSPADFIPVAEEIGLIDSIGDWVIEAACRQLQQWRSAGFTDLSMSINLSAGQFVDATLPHRLRKTVATLAIPPDCITLEVTETIAMAAPDKSIAVLNTLRHEGFALSIDDFGTGYSSLAYLKLFPFNTLKIDRSFVRDIETDANDASICDVTVLLAHKLGHDTIAEGVENAEQLKFLLSIGCEKIQGYLISKPLPADAAGAFLQNHPLIKGIGTVDLWQS